MGDQSFALPSCAQCVQLDALGFAFTMAFQPIVDVATRVVFAHEALVRGVGGEGSESVFAHVNDGNRYRFDQACRVKALELASKLAIPCHVSINFLPNAVYRPELCIRTTLAAAERYGFPIDRIIFEIAESERVTDVVHMRSIVEHYKQRGFLTAIDDFGAGYAGLNLLAEVRVDIVKLDMALIRHIDADPGRRAIVRGVVQVCRELSMRVVAEGVETADEYLAVCDLGVDYVQGFYLARPAFESLAEVALV